MGDSDEDFFGHDSHHAGDHHVKKKFFKPNLTNITEETGAIDRFNNDWEHANKLSFLRLPDSFVASPNSYRFNSPPASFINQSMDESPASITGRSAETPPQSSIGQSIEAPPQSSIGRSIEAPPQSFIGRSTEAPPQSFIGLSAEAPPQSSIGRSIEAPPQSSVGRSIEAPPQSFIGRSAEAPPHSFIGRSTEAPPQSFIGRSAEAPPQSFIGRSAEAPPQSFIGRSAEAPPHSFIGRSTEAPPQSFIGRSAEAPPQSFIGRSAEAPPQSFIGRSDEAPPQSFIGRSAEVLPALDLSPSTPVKSILSRTVYKSFVDSPTFVANCTRKGFPNTKISGPLEMDRKAMYFGFRPVHSESEDAIAVTNICESAVTLSFSILPEGAQKIFKLEMHSSTMRLAPRKKAFLRFVFSPPDVQRYRARCSIEVAMGNELLTTSITLLGFGGQANVIPLQTERGKKTIAISSTGRYQMFPLSTNSFKFSLKNVGQRDAFAFVVVQDNNGVELPTEKAIANPSNFWLAKNGLSSSEKTVYVRIFDSPDGLGKTRSIGGSQRSLTSLSTRPPSTMDSSVNSVTQAMPPAFRILVFWGEERQRQRLKIFEQNNTDANYMTVLNRCLWWKIEGETSIATEKETCLSQEDRRNCISSMRYTLIQIVGRKSHSHSRNVSSRTGRGNTVIEMEPDDTLKAYESLCGDNTLTIK